MFLLGLSWIPMSLASCRVAVRAAIFVMLVVTATNALLAFDLYVTSIQIGLDNRPRIDHTARSNHYYLLLRGDSITTIVQPVSAALFANVNAVMSDQALINLSQSAFYRVREVPVSEPLDSDGDGLDDVYELLRPLYLDPLNPDDG